MALIEDAYKTLHARITEIVLLISDLITSKQIAGCVVLFVLHRGLRSRETIDTLTKVSRKKKRERHHQLGKEEKRAAHATYS